MASKSHIGSDLDHFLREEGLLDDIAAVAFELVVDWQLDKVMKTVGFDSSEGQP